MDSLFTPEELSEAELVPPFPFTKNCPLLKLPARHWTDPFPFGTLLFDVLKDPLQVKTLEDEELENRLLEELISLIKDNHALDEQFVRLGLDDIASS